MKYHIKESIVFLYLRHKHLETEVKNTIYNSIKIHEIHGNKIFKIFMQDHHNKSHKTLLTEINKDIYIYITGENTVFMIQKTQY